MDEEAPIDTPSEYVFHHVFFPPKLPNFNDTTTEAEVEITKLFNEAVLSFSGLLPDDSREEWSAISPMLTILLDNGNLGHPFRSLNETMRDMVDGDVLALHITRQNAGLIVRKKSDTFFFETFELSATSKAVMGTTGRLVRRFPGPMISVSDTRVYEGDFLSCLEHSLTVLESETLEDTVTKGYGAHNDTVSPHFVTEWLPGILRAIGSPINATRIFKRTRDEVLVQDDQEQEVFTTSLKVKRWGHIQKFTDSAGIFDLADLAKLRPASNTLLSLATLRPYLEQIHNVQLQQRDGDTFEGKSSPRIKGSQNSLPDYKLFDSRSSFEVHLSLKDLETWVSNCLESWIDLHKDSKHCLIKLTQAISWYMNTALPIYADSPEAFSIMVLTLLLLWVALDKVACLHYPLLKQFDPGFPSAFFDPLLLPKRYQMVQLRDVEQYLLSRKGNSSAENPSVFGDISSPKSFGVQYFDQSLPHQELKVQIEMKASADCEAKKTELQDAKASFSRFMAESKLLNCTSITKPATRRYPQGRVIHNPECDKCELRQKAQSLEISCHEWPLPTSEAAAKSVVFELDMPSLLRCWRSMTYRILFDVLSPAPPPFQTKPKTLKISKYSGLSNYFKSKTDRLQLASTTKSFLGTMKPVAEATEEIVCLPNHLNLIIEDSRSQHRATDHLNKYAIRDRCTLILPPGCYESLQYALCETKHTSNEIISRQGACPEGLTVHELYAYGTLRSGHRLQWLNIAREIVSRTLDFGKEEVYLLMLQASWQAGPSALQQVSRDSHVELEEESYGLDLILILEEALASVESNWQGSIAALTFISLASRLLSISLHDSVRERCLKFLNKARHTTIEWARVIFQLLHKCTMEKDIGYLTLRALDVALICHSTFDVDPRQVSTLLSSTENVAILIEISATINEHWPVSVKVLTPMTQELLRRFSRTLYAIEAALKGQVLASSEGVNQAVQHMWDDYEPGISWGIVEAPNDRWIKTQTAAGENGVSLSVYFNTLDGSLLVNGRSLGRLPRDYEVHPNYQRLFGDQILEVMPSTMGLDFATRSSVQGFQLHFALRESDLIIRASQGSELYELVPTHALEKDFPHSFVHNYVHWMNKRTMAIEWRPLEAKWLSSPENWRISSPENPATSKLISKSRHLINIASKTAMAIYQWLKPLETSNHINIYFDEDIENTEICLPRMGLDFVLRDAGLESKQFRGMFVDKNQHFGTLNGLLNKLVLTDTRKSSRIVLIPHSIPNYHQKDHHVEVSISTGNGEKVLYHHFVIDKYLGSLIDNGSLLSRLFKLYLHALTSNCLTDSLTSRTGTEEALHGLRLAGTQSFLTLEPEHIEILELFVRLTPARDFYPRGSNLMQSVEWDRLSPLSQHEDFATEACSMSAKAESLQVFQPGLKSQAKVEQRGAENLHKRALIRNAFYRVDTFGAESFTSACDGIYNEARDSITDSKREHEACNIAFMVDRWQYKLNPYSNLMQEIQKWGTFIHGPEADFKFQFDRRWLQSPSTFMPGSWCSMQSFLSQVDASRDKSGVMMFLATLASSQHGNIPLVNTLLAFCTVPALRNLQPPSYAGFDLSKGFKPKDAMLTSIFEECKVAYKDSPEKRIMRLPNEVDADLEDRHASAYRAATTLQIKKCLREVREKWPVRNIVFDQTQEIKTYLPGLEASMPKVQSLLEAWYMNYEFEGYIQDIQSVLDTLLQPSTTPDFFSIPNQVDSYQPKRGFLKMEDLLKKPAPELSRSSDDLELWSTLQHEQPIERGASKLKSLLARLGKSANGHYEKMYVKDLQKSHKAFLDNTTASPTLGRDVDLTILQKHLYHCKRNVDALFKKICSKLISNSSLVYDSANQISLLPRLSPSILLRLLARFNPVVISTEWKATLSSYALSIAAMQRAERLVACGDRETDIVSQLVNTGHENWDPVEFSDWLLLELESNILIRPEQAQIAREMIAPPSGKNSVMQLNMGLGKSSVIVPIVAATLADGSKLARVVVLKSLSEQMFQLLVSKLGGLVGRIIYRLPVSRSLAPNLNTAKLIQQVYKECMSSGGILLVEPESLLSFELLGLDYVLTKELNPHEPESNFASGTNVARTISDTQKYETGRTLLKTQQWLYRHSRDVLDESDELLSVRYELIYTLGIQQNIQFSPYRWGIIQHVLGVLVEVARDMASEMPDGLEILEVSAGAFPRIRILLEAAGRELLMKVAQSICRSGMPTLATWTFSRQEKDIVLEFITNLRITKARVKILETKVYQTEYVKLTLLLLRGLFATGVLHFVFAKKRWRVNYGLDLSRSMLAVPYHAKDHPSPRSEFSHPDTSIALTCLSYYYGGLTNLQIRNSFEFLLLSDHAQEDYVQWIQYCENLPKHFKRLAGVNLRDVQQCETELFPELRYSKGLIDFYVQHLVFPKEMKEFTNKLSSSGWEIAREKKHPTTGFSGTNDSKYMLPTPIKQCELPEQMSTNAEVLYCLLRPENSYNTESTLPSESSCAAALIEMSIGMEPPARVLIDVGAQLLEDNQKIATSWLDRVALDDAAAVVFFEKNDLFVLNREGSKELLQVSPFAKQMERCLVYLDEAHTRGTDLKMPQDYRAIVTLGPDLTKDRLAQACKRLRKLGSGQSVVFCAPLEVQSKILVCCGKDNADLIEVADVLLWAIHNSWEFTKKGMSLWATQGLRHYRRRAACDFSEIVPRIPVGILEPEALTLEERYGVDNESADEGVVCRDRIQVDNDVTRAEICSIRSKCREFGLRSFGDSDLHEEQERELHPENEREEQVESPKPSKAYKHILHENVRDLVRTGHLASDEGISQAFKLFNATTAKEMLNLENWPQSLLMTHDFATTVQVPHDGNQDSFLRPVTWVLSFQGENQETSFLIMSPFEVQELLPHMRGQDRVRLHVYTPRLSLSYRSLEDLAFCAVPPVAEDWQVPEISTSLNLFAGQLYIRNAKEYRKLCRFLGVRFLEAYGGAVIRADGFISTETRDMQDDETAASCEFASSPIDFLRMVAGFRRLGQSFSNSHMGKILSGELVKGMDFEVFERVEVFDDPMDVDDEGRRIKPEPSLFVD